MKKPAKPATPGSMSPQAKVGAMAKRALESKPMQLPFWRDHVYGYPNELARSALFNVRNERGATADRAYYEDVPVVVYGDGSISYRGQELRQSDLDVWLQVLHLAREQKLGDWVEFTPYSFLKALGRSTSSDAYDRLREHLSRLQATSLAFYSSRLTEGVSVSLVRRFEWKMPDGTRLPQWRVWIEPEMRTLFDDRYVTLLQQDIRHRLGAMAKWLHGFYASHADPFPVKVATLWQSCGSSAKTLSAFRNRVLKDALGELVAVGFLVEYRIDPGSDLVYVSRA